MTTKQLPGQQGPGQGIPTVRGTIDLVPCPHCGAKNDFRDLDQQNLVDTKSKFLCDHCGQAMMLVAIHQVKVFTVCKTQSDMGMVRAQKSQAQQPAYYYHQGQLRQGPQQPQAKPGLINRLLGGPKKR